MKGILKKDKDKEKTKEKDKEKMREKKVWSIVSHIVFLIVLPHFMRSLLSAK